MTSLGHPLVGAFGALLTGGLFYLSRDLGDHGPLVLIAPVPVLVYALTARRAWTIAFAAFAARVLGAGALVQTYGAILPLPAIGALVLMHAVGFAITVLLTRFVFQRAGTAAALLTFPAFTTGGEYVLSVISPHGSFGALGYAMTDLLPLLQLASLGGVPLLSFAASLVAIAGAVLVVRPSAWRSFAFIAAAPMAAALVFGVVRMNEPYERQVRIGLVSIDAEQFKAFVNDAAARQTASAYAEAALGLGDEAPDFVVLPEKVFAGGAVSLAPLMAASAAIDATIIAGFDETLNDGRRVNSARVITRNGGETLYAKRRLIPGLETGYTIGEGPLVMGAHGVAICKDMDFAPMIRDYGQRGVDLLFAPAWDFVRDGRLHARMAVVRGVENGFALARAAAHGRLTLSDRYGRIISEEVTNPTRPVALVADLGLRGGGTLYARVGDVFAWAALALCVGLLAAAFVRKPTAQLHS